MDAWSYFKTQIGNQSDIFGNLDNPTVDQIENFSPKRRKQKWWQTIFDKAELQKWELTAPLRTRKLRELSAARNSTDITSLVLTEPGQPQMSSRNWSLLLRFRLGMSLADTDFGNCPGCNTSMNSSGDHVLCCSSLGIYSRHNAIRNEFATICTELHLTAQLEQGLADGSRPADVLVHGLYPEPLAVDFSVTHSLQSSIQLAEVQSGKAATKVEKDKIKEMLIACRRRGWQFRPFVMETVGTWGGKARNLLQPIARRWAFLPQVTLAQAAGDIRRWLQLTLLCELERQLERGFHAGEEQEDDSTPVDLFSF